MARATHSRNDPGARKIRSFVRRTGRMTPAQRRAIDTLWPGFGIDFAGERLDLDEVFGRAAPRVLEIGFGNGETLVELARQNPGTDFLGIEVHEPGVGHCLLAARDAGVSNLRVIIHDAVEVLETGISGSAIARINLYFPDPWPKKRHHKRRILQPAFLALCADRLSPGGTLRIATDWDGYAEYVDELVAASEHFACTERRVHDGDEPLDRPMTKFEQRGLRRGHRIRDWCLEIRDIT